MSSVALIASMIAATGSSIARRMSSVEVTTIFGSPVTRSRPRISACSSSSSSQAEPIVILISSAVRSPIARLYSFLTKLMIASSSSSPAIRIDWLVTMPPSEITATSVVPPPMSTTMFPVGSCDRQAGPDRRRHRLLDDVGVAGAGGLGGLLDGALLDAGDARGHADHDLRAWRPPVGCTLRMK